MLILSSNDTRHWLQIGDLARGTGIRVSLGPSKSTTLYAKFGKIPDAGHTMSEKLDKKMCESPLTGS